MAKTGYVKTALTGGGSSALDGILGSVLLDGDFAFVGVGNLAYFYILDADYGDVAEYPPATVKPDTAYGTKMWVLQNYLSNGFTGTSATSLTVGTGTQTLTVETNKGFVAGMYVLVSRTADPAGTWMYGTITTYTQATGVFVVEVSDTLGSGVHSDWTVSFSAPTVLSAFANPTKMYFYQNTAPTGWTIDAAIADVCLAVKGGSNAYNVSGGNIAGTWTQPSHTHTGPSHTHTGPLHTHTGPSHTHYTNVHSHSMSFMSSGGSDPVEVGIGTGVTVNFSGHGHSVDGQTANGDSTTAAGGTAATGAGGTAVTGVGGTGATSGSATAATFRPYAAIGIVATKD